MKKWLLHSSLLIAIAFSFLACAQQNVESKPASSAKYLTVLHTNDNHGRFWHNDAGEYGMPARQSLLKELRAEAKKKGHQVLLLSGGDINTGVPESDLQQAEPDFKGMRLLEYDAMAIGNHEFDNSVDILAKQQEWAGFPFLSANIFHKGSGDHAYQTHEIFEKGGLKIAVVGLTTTDTAKIGNPEYISHLEFRDAVPVTQQLVDQLKQKHKLDVVIAVTHMGHYVDTKRGINAPGDVTLARNLKPNTVDIIIGGHSQEPLCMLSENVEDKNYYPGKVCKPDFQNGTWIMQAFEWGKYVGKAEFKVQDGQLSLLDYQLIPVNLKPVDGLSSAFSPLTPDADVYRFLEPFQEKGAKQIGQPFAVVKGELVGSRNKVRKKQTNLGHLIAAAQMQQVGADFGVISSGGIRNSLYEGSVDLKDVLSVHPFKNRIIYVDMSGQDITEFLSTIGGFPPSAGAYPQIFGASFTMVNGKATNIKVQGSPINLSKTYRFSINSYNAVGGDGYPVLVNHPGYVETQYIDAEVLKNYLEKHSPIDAEQYLPKQSIKYQ